jgi:uncharacterized membrane protein
MFSIVILAVICQRYEHMRREIELFIFNSNSKMQCKFLQSVLHGVPENILVVGEPDEEVESKEKGALPSVQAH